MKGLLKNNFYSVAGSLKSAFFMVILGLIATAALAVGAMYYNYDGQALLQVIVFSNSGVFVGLSSTAMLLDKTTKWSTFEITLPVTREHVVRARYITFLIYGWLGLVVCVAHYILFFLLTKQLQIDQLYFTFTFTMMFALQVPTIAYPLTLRFGEEKAQLMFTIAVGICIFMFFCCSSIFSLLMPPNDDYDIYFCLFTLAISVLIFIASYFCSVRLQYKKEMN